MPNATVKESAVALLPGVDVVSAVVKLAPWRFEESNARMEVPNG